MQKIVQGIPVVVIIVATGMLIYSFVEHRKETENLRTDSATTAVEKVTADRLPIAAELPVADRRLAEQAFKSPEKLDASEPGTSADTGTPAGRPPERPLLLSAIEPDESSPFPAANTVGNQDRYFQKDFESLRTDAVRNPDSAQNRATVKTLMQKRQQRLDRQEL